MVGLILASIVAVFGAVKVFALSTKLTAEQFSLENIYAQLQRRLVSTNIMTTEDARALSIPDDSKTIAIYLEDTGSDKGYIILRSSAGDQVLVREKVEYLNFELLKSTAREYSNYALSVEVSGGMARDERVPRSATRRIALHGLPEKNGNPVLTKTTSAGEAWSGPAISFTSSGNEFK